jgi:hypothetical protein
MSMFKGRRQNSVSACSIGRRAVHERRRCTPHVEARASPDKWLLALYLKGGALLKVLSRIIFVAILCLPGCRERNHLDLVVRAIQERLSKSPNPWPEQWRLEYIATVRNTILKHKEADAFSNRVNILHEAFPHYWENTSRSVSDEMDFEVSKAQIQWYVENLMSGELPSYENLSIVKSQTHELLRYGADSIQGEFAFLRPDVVDAAVQDCEGALQQTIDYALVPAFQKPLREDQIKRIKDAWNRAYRMRSDLWNSELRYALHAQPSNTNQADPARSIYYAFANRCLGMFIGQIRETAVSPPEYLARALAQRQEEAIAHQRTSREAFMRERRLWPGHDGNVEQIEQWTFVFASLLAESQPRESRLDAEGKSSVATTWEGGGVK